VSDLLQLAERVEKATGPDRDLNIAMLPLVGLRFVDEGHPIGQVCYDSNNHAVPLPNFTASIDAAMSLVPEGCNFGLGDKDATTKAWAWVGLFSGPDNIANAATPAIALCAAALRARGEGGGNG
jgi:hypothetical protein